MKQKRKRAGTEQEAFWRGAFGDEYIKRNKSRSLLAANTALFAKILASTDGISSVLELGANIGLNLQAIRVLRPEISLSAVEINRKAAAGLRRLGKVDIHPVSILDFKPARQWDLVLTKTVLIHMPPEALPAVYDLLHRSSRRYICMAEYYNPAPVEVRYRGHERKLFKRDFPGEFMDRFPDVRLRDYGFVYHRDANFPQDDITWFLIEKTGAA